MATLLRLDGIDDKLSLPSMTFTRINVDGVFYKRAWGSIIMSGSLEWYIGENGTSDVSEGGMNRLIDEDGTKAITDGTRHVFSMIPNNPTTGSIDIFCSTSYGDSQQGDVYSITVWNGETIVAQYDMSTGNVNDTSGNNLHATLIGGAWVEDGSQPPTNTAPSITSTFNATTFTNEESISIPYNVVDSEGGVITATLTKDNIHANQTVSTGANVWNVGTLSVGNHVLRIRVSDSSGLTSNELVFNLVITQVEGGETPELPEGQYYLTTDGVDDYATTPSMPFNEIIITMRNVVDDFLYIPPADWVWMESSVITTFTARTGQYTGLVDNTLPRVILSGIYINSANITTISIKTPEELPITEQIYFFTGNNGYFGSGEFYDIKILLNGVIQAHYDLTKGNFLDQSTNSRHATLYGGAWMESGEPIDILPPKVTILNVSRTKISANEGMNESVITFSFNEDVEEWITRVNGVDAETGILADSGGSVTANTVITATISHDELNSEGENRVNFYGRDSSGNWTTYSQEFLSEGSSYGTMRYGTTIYGTTEID